MIEAGVCIVSYGEDHSRDFHQLASKSDFRDEALDSQLRTSIHPALQGESWQKDQVCYFSMPVATEASEFLLACRVTCRYSEVRRTPYRELIAVYVDRSRIFGGPDPSALFAGIDWEDLRRRLPGSVELKSFKPTMNEFGSSLASELIRKSRSGQPCIAERHYSNLRDSFLLGVAMDCAPGDAKSKARVVVGADPTWKFFEDFVVRVFGVPNPTPFDAGSREHSQYLKSQGTALLISKVPMSYLDMRSANFTGETIEHAMLRAEQQGDHLGESYAHIVSTLNDRMASIKKEFEIELSSVTKRDGLSANEVAEIRKAWTSFARLTTFAIPELRNAPVRAPDIKEGDIRRIAQETAASVFQAYQPNVRREVEPIVRDMINQRFREFEDSSRRHAHSPENGEHKDPPLNSAGAMSRRNGLIVGLFLLIIVCCLVFAYLRGVMPSPTEAESEVPDKSGAARKEAKNNPKGTSSEESGDGKALKIKSDNPNKGSN